MSLNSLIFPFLKKKSPSCKNSPHPQKKRRKKKEKKKKKEKEILP
jgi:hypothetical protein